MSEDWEQITVHKPGRIVGPSLGQRAMRVHVGIDRRTGGVSASDPKPRKLTSGERSAQGRLAQHALCIEHVAVTGLRQRVCITRGADREAILAEARELAGGGDR